ncbi:uncharacterized protein BDZ99DRAFT_503439 [Mytilinidion resinicola]|uniref:Autophagy-related protein 2 n=1 Tax=Mytilinidion resinicola TaxID=574789 RepID=A0A6A6Y490_9PEZI|nr:uncharacterized protein BDZ99DRAFT_503439 [Mytilinidion resinicola]KAF2803045.1 hypothetical protein BDZ99DRAFT_503439 [Mytilinidion resinicola]
MAFFTTISSSIGKRILLYALRHADILDKDPSDFVDVAVGKRTTLEVRDVGLRVKKLITLLNLNLPQELHLSKARVSHLRVTLAWEAGSPRILIEIEGVQVQARLAPDVPEPSGKSKAGAKPGPRSAPNTSAQAPPQDGPRQRKALADSTSTFSSDDEDEYIPTAEELAKSFLREEPAEEIKELEEALNTQSEYLQESVMSSEDGDDESEVGMGTGIGLPVMLKNYIVGALDRLEITAKDIDIQIDGDLPPESASESNDDELSSVAINLHVEQVSIDGVASGDPEVKATPVQSSSQPPPVLDTRDGKRRMRVENICARLISDPESFASLSKVSRSSSPVDTRSDISIGQKSNSSSSVSGHSSGIAEDDQLPSASGSQCLAQSNHSTHSRREERPLEASILSTDEDRFADAAIDDDYEGRRSYIAGLEQSETLGQSRQSVQNSRYDFGGESSLFNDDGIIDYVANNGFLNSQYEGADDGPPPSPQQRLSWALDGNASSHEIEASIHEKEAPQRLSATAPAPQALSSKDSYSKLRPVSSSEPNPASKIFPSTDNLDTAKHHALDAPPEAPRRDSSSSSGSSVSREDLAQSKMFTHEEAESMYLSAMSAAPTQASRHLNVPGGWDSSSTSSEGTAPEELSSVPPVMSASTIFPVTTEGDDGCETPRPGSRASVIAAAISPAPRMGTTESTGNISGTPATGIANSSFSGTVKVAKPFLSIDKVNVWFPLDLSGAENSGMGESAMIEDSLDRMQATTEFGDESIFRDMPGSFSFYAESTASRRRKSASETTEARRPPMPLRPSKTDRTPPTPMPVPRRRRHTGVEVEVGTICAQVDISAGRMMFQLAQRVLAILGPQNVESNPKQSLQDQPRSSSESLIKVSIEQVSFAWLERLIAESVTAASHSQPAFKLDSNTNEAILWLNLKALQITGRSKGKESVMKLNIGKFLLGSLNQQIISFDAGARSRRSAHAGDRLEHDIQVELRESSDRRLHMATRPIKVLFDLQKLDDALGSFGGFSGVLELGNSITSNQTAPRSPSPPPTQRPRGVHFGDAPPPAVIPDSTSALKVSIKLGDVFFQLKGKTCAVHMQTSSVKMVVRGSNVRIVISDIQLTGPFLEFTRDEPPFITEIKDLNITFLFSPEEVDLTRLLSIITPSKDKYENDSDILIDTLLRQRRKGSVIRVNIAGLGVRMSDLGCLEIFQDLSIELARLSTVTKYLPEDDRPGILTLGAIKQLEGSVMVNEKIGFVDLKCYSTQFAHVGLPPLFAVEIGKIALNHGKEILIDEVAPLRPLDELPMIMARIIGDEMEPTLRVKMFNLCLEYRVSTIMAALGLSEDGTIEEVVAGIASSVATITGNASPKALSRQSSESTESSRSAKLLHIEVLVRDCALGLNPRKVPSKGLFVLTDTRLSGQLPKNEKLSASLELRKASILIIDDIDRIEDTADSPQSTPHSHLRNQQITDLERSGFVLLSTISAAKAMVNISGIGEDQQLIDVEFKNDLVVLETCADSTQTLIGILNGLSPPMPPSTAQRYRTVVPFQTMMDSFTGDAFATISAEDAGEGFSMDDADHVDDEVPTNLEYVGSFYNPDSIPSGEDIGDSMLEADDLHSLATPPPVRQRGAGVLLESFQEQYEVAQGEQDFDFDDNYFGSNSEYQGTARKWDSTKNQYKLSNEFKASNSPLKVRIRDMQVIWNLFDGYDWPKTRDTVTNAVENIEQRAEERRQRRAARLEEDTPNVMVEEDYLFNSVWISIPVNEEKGALYKKINHDVDDLVSETGSYATTTTASQATARQRTGPRTKRRKLKLERSKHKKITFELRGIDADLVIYPPGSDETQSSVNVRVRDFEIFDHVPSSTWRKFATCLIEPSKREMDRPMINLELLTVKPIQDLAASEIVLRVTVLPLRLHVDQDALDFITRFFEFKDETATPSGAKPDIAFLQRVEVDTVQIKLDYKPKKVNYAGLRSGHTTEFMNFVILDEANIVLRHAILYGIPGFDKLHDSLSAIWTPDVIKNQIPNIIAGLSGVRSLVNVGSGVKDLFVIPVQEYKKDGRIVRSLQKGAFAFGKNTTIGMARLGAKLAVGAQTALEGIEGLVSPQDADASSSTDNGWEDLDPDEERRAISHYANQPLGVMAGFRGAARHFERDLLTARDAIIAIPTEVMESGSASGAAKAVWRRAPTVIIRPALGTTKAVGNALFGLSNAADPDSRRKLEDKYKSSY